MRILSALMIVFLLVGSIPFFVGDQGAREERSDPQMGAPPARGNTIIVDINGTGDYLTIQDAINNSQNGDTIYIKKGVYNEYLWVNKSLTINSYTDDKPVIRSSNDPTILVINSNSKFINLVIQNSAKKPSIQLNSRTIFISNCILNFGWNSIIINDHVTDIIIDKTKFSNLNMAVSGAPTYSGDGYFIFTNNTFNKCGGLSLQVHQGVNKNTIIANNIFDRCGFGIDIGDFSETTTINDNVFINCSKYITSNGLTLSSDSNYCFFNIFNNIFFNNSICLQTFTSASDLNADIHNNYFYKSDIAFQLRGYKSNIFSNDIIGNNIGFNLSCGNVKINNNNIIDNIIGIKLGGNLNTIYNNKIINNTYQCTSGGLNNKLFIDYQRGGNYWSDYPGRDRKTGENQDLVGSDGYGDDPVRIGETLDKYPLVFDKTKPIADLGKDITIDEGTNYLITIGNSTDNNLIVDVKWSFYYNNILLPPINGMEFYYKFDKPGNCIISMTAYDFRFNNDTDYMNITILDNRLPTALSQGNLTCDEGSTPWFNGSRSTDTGVISKHEWIFYYKGETHTLEGINVSFFFDKPGIVPVTLWVTDSAGHTGEDHFTVTIIDLTNPLSNAGVDQTIDNERFAIFNGSLSTDNGLLMEYNWTFEYEGRKIQLQGIESSYKFDKPGIYNITLEVTDQFGNKAIDWLTLTVRDTIKPIPVITGLTTFLENENIKLSGKSSTDNGVIDKYVWTIVDNGTITIQGVDLDYKVKIRGYHKVFLTVFDEWGNNATVNLTVNAIDSNKPFTAAGPDQEVAVGTTVTLDASGSHDDGTITKYQWTFSYDNQNEELLGRIVTFKFDKPGTYEITLKVFDDSDNYGIDTVTITVKNTGVVKGIVLDDNGKPVDGALVEIVASDGKTYSFTTAPDGSFSIAIPPGSFTWKISKDGYGTITGSSTVDILGENTLDLAGTPMKKTASTGTSPILIIVPAVIVILLILGAVIFLVMKKKKKSAPETMEAKPEGEKIPPEPAEGGAPVETTLPPESSEFVQAPPVMEEDVPIEKVEENTTVDDLLKEPGQ
jgi:hypothetical protein